MISETRPTYLGTIAVANNAYRALLRADDKAIDAKAGFDAARTAAGAARNAFHGRCDATGAHVLVAVCACGANLIVCPAGGNRPERRKWQA